MLTFAVAIALSASIVMAASTLTESQFKATTHKDRLTALYVICLHIFRHLAQKILDRR